MPLNDLNKINIAEWKTNPNVAVNIGKIIEKASWAKSLWEPFVGAGADRGVRTYKVEKAGPFRPRLKTQLAGDGVKGNADFKTNFDDLEILSQTLYPETIGNSIKSEIKLYSEMQQIDFIKEATDSLTDWLLDRRDRQFVTALSNDITNAVVCDAASGYKDTTADKDVATASKKIVVGDVLNVAAIRRAIFMARAGKNFKGRDAFPIKPIRATAVTTGGLTIQNYGYVILLDSYQINQLKADKEWADIQKSAGVRGESNNLYTGLAGMIDGCPVIDMGVWTRLQSGLLNSEVSDADFRANINAQNHKELTPPSKYAGTQPVSIGFLIGASALVIAGSERTNFYIDDTQDAGRKTLCGADRVLAVSKGRFENSKKSSVYADTDFAVIGIFSSKE